MSYYDDPYGVYEEYVQGNNTSVDGIANRPDGSVYYPGPAAGMPALYPQQQPGQVWNPETGIWEMPTTAPGPTQNTGTATAPPPAPSGGGFSGDSGSSTYNGAGFAWPQFNAPKFQAPAPFSFEAFKAPTLDDAYAEPGYEFARREGQRALENSAAGKGVLRTGGTLKDLAGWGNKFAEQNYGNVYNRAASTYDRNRNNAADTYATNYGVSRDVFDRDYKGAYDEFQPKQRQAELTFDDLYRRWKAELDGTITVAGMGD